MVFLFCSWVVRITNQLLAVVGVRNKGFLVLPPVIAASRPYSSGGWGDGRTGVWSMVKAPRSAPPPADDRNPVARDIDLSGRWVGGWVGWEKSLKHSKKTWKCLPQRAPTVCLHWALLELAGIL